MIRKNGLYLEDGIRALKQQKLAKMLQDSRTIWRNRKAGKPKAASS